jgi:hypothetical protein
VVELNAGLTVSSWKNWFTPLRVIAELCLGVFMTDLGLLHSSIDSPARWSELSNRNSGEAMPWHSSIHYL